ncbi:hypothetical protein [Hyphococcus lacteus]|uniref:Uncharacterized protein n=1 Tax=Hyphococcus lacteus TaxID=3143536 RepID=A0ABV3Z1U1_9PROT
MLSALITIAAVQVATARPPMPATIEEALEIVQLDEACERSEYPSLRMTMYLCQEKLTSWYFTVPDNTLSPGFVRRMVIRDGKAIKMLTDSKYFGTDSQETAFFEWQTDIAESIGQ